MSPLHHPPLPSSRHPGPPGPSRPPGPADAGPPTPPLLLTADPAVRESVLRLAAAAGATPLVLDDPVHALHRWAAAPLVLVGHDLAPALAALGPPRRDAVHLLVATRPPDGLFRTALLLGAEGVVEVDRAEAWLVEALTDAGLPARRGHLVGVVGGSGGAGATTLACALGQVAGRDGPAVVVDCDPLGPGVDRVLGLDAEPGFRWDALEQTTGRLSGAALRDALPRHRGVGALTWHAGQRGSIQAFAVREALSAACRGHDTVVVDLPRGAATITEEIAARVELLVVVVVPTVVGVAAAAQVTARLRERAAPAVVVRGRGLDESTIAGAVGAPVLAVVPELKVVAQSVDLGLGPLRARRGGLWRACADVLEVVGAGRRAAA